VPVLEGTATLAVEGLRRGGYVLAEALDADGRPTLPSLIVIGTGSELGLAVAVRARLQAEGVATRVVSLPCWEAFGAQPRDYRDAVLPPAVTKRVSVEAGVSLGWDRWVGPEGAMIAIERFGASAPGPVVLEHFGFRVGPLVVVAPGVLAGPIGGVIAATEVDHV